MMFLRANNRFKDGKPHRYWSVVENRRVAGGRSVQKTLLYLGEINDSDKAAWTRAIEAVDERADAEVSDGPERAFAKHLRFLCFLLFKFLRIHS